MPDFASASTLESLLDAVGIGLVRARADGRVASVNAAFAAMLGCPVGDIVGEPVDAFLHPEEADVPVAALGAVPGRATGTPDDAAAPEAVWRLARLDDLDAWARVSTTDDGDGGAVWVVEDVTALVAAERRARMREREFRFVSDTMAQMIWITEADSHHRYFNQQWYAYTGLPDGATDGWGWADVLHPDDYARTEARWRHSLETGEVYEIEYRFRRHDGVYRWQLGRANPHRRADGSIEMWVGTCTDIHDAREAADEHRLLLADLAAEREALHTLTATLEARIAERTRALERSNAELQAFAYVASHDLQEPIRKILSYADLVRHDAPTGAIGPDASDSLDRLQGAAHRMSRLIRDLLALARVTTNGDRFAETDLGAVLDGVLSDLEVMIASTGAVVEVGPLPILDADATQMRQVFQNLIQNAIKYRRAGAPPVVRIASAPSGERYVAITVADNGTGFAARDAERIFAPFQRLVGRSVEGSGIGLSIVRRIVERHGGAVTAVSTPGEGTTFTLDLPLRHDTSDDASA